MDKCLVNSEQCQRIIGIGTPRASGMLEGSDGYGRERDYSMKTWAGYRERSVDFARWDHSDSGHSNATDQGHSGSTHLQADDS